jgi:hypothetical protein
MLTWKVRYWDLIEEDIYEITSQELNWVDLPKFNVIDVEIVKGNKKHILKGYDNYWIDGFLYGCFNNTGELGEQEEQNRLNNGHLEVVYEGLQSATYQWENEHIFIDDYEVDKDLIYYIEGIMLPDEIAIQIGIL